APVDPTFLTRETTWIHAAFTGLIVAVTLASREPNAEYEPFQVRDVAFTASASLNAGVAEEALFRGWLLPVLHETTGHRFWLANTLQAGAFGALHAHAPEAAAVAAAWSLYEG